MVIQHSGLRSLRASLAKIPCHQGLARACRQETSAWMPCKQSHFAGITGHGQFCFGLKRDFPDLHFSILSSRNQPSLIRCPCDGQQTRRPMESVDSLKVGNVIRVKSPVARHSQLFGIWTPSEPADGVLLGLELQDRTVIRVPHAHAFSRCSGQPGSVG